MSHMSDEVGVKPRRLITVFAMLAIACALSIWGSRWVVDRIYSGELLPDLFTNRSSQSIEHYYNRVTPIVIAGYVFLGLVAALGFALRLQSAAVIFGILIVGDVIFCALSEIYGGVLSIRVDGGVPEWFQYLKEIVIAIALMRLARTTGHRIFFAWGCLFAFLFLDDSLRYHERAGTFLAGLPLMETLAQRLEVRAVDVAELFSVGPLLLAFLGAIAFYFLRERAAVRRAALLLGALLGVLLFFAGVMDLVDRIATTRGSDLAGPLSLLEDGGEMVTMSAILAYVAAIFWHPGRFGLDQPASRQPTGPRV